ncbi:MAG: hypothetical protein WD069_04800 [Planctomycetales bacterium]
MDSSDRGHVRVEVITGANPELKFPLLCKTCNETRFDKKLENRAAPNLKPIIVGSNGLSGHSGIGSSFMDGHRSDSSMRNAWTAILNQTLPARKSDPA